jgi:hypothetical protein
MALSKYEKLLGEYDKHCLRIAQATSININETAVEKAQHLKEVESEYLKWFEDMFPVYAKKKSAKFHKKLADAIIKDRQIKALVEAYRSSGKSVHVDLGIPLYLYFVKRDLNFMLLIGETEDKAKKLLSSIQAELQYNKRLIHYYGNRFKSGDWANGDFATSDGVRFMSLGFGQNPRGAREQAERPDYIVVDDVDNKRHFNNDRIMRESVEFIQEDVWGCFDAADDATERFVYANNNAHKNSITNRLAQFWKEKIKEAKAEGEKHNFYHLRVDAVKDLVSFEPTWPEKTTSAYWKKKFRDRPFRSFMREYMNTHVEEGKVFKHNQIQFTKILPYHKYDAICAYGDLSFEDNACHKAIVVVGKIGRQFHILHVFFRQSSRAHIAKWLYDLYEDKRLRKEAVRYLIEGLFAMGMFVSDFDEEGDLRGYHIPVVASKRAKSGKFDRIEAMSGWFERMNVFFNEAEKDNADQILLRDTLLAFEKGAGIPLDGLDAMQGGFEEVNQMARVDKFPAKTTSRSDVISKSKNRF